MQVLKNRGVVSANISNCFTITSYRKHRPFEGGRHVSREKTEGLQVCGEVTGPGVDGRALIASGPSPQSYTQVSKVVSQKGRSAHLNRRAHRAANAPSREVVFTVCHFGPQVLTVVEVVTDGGTTARVSDGVKRVNSSTIKGHLTPLANRSLRDCGSAIRREAGRSATISARSRSTHSSHNQSRDK